MRDIENRNDIELLVDSFYKRVLTDDLISVFFTDVIELNWDMHIPIMYSFWESTLLGKAGYKGNPMLKHIELNKKKALKPEHFERWITLWETTVKENFTGARAEEAVKKARQIAELMKYKIKQVAT